MRRVLIEDKAPASGTSQKRRSPSDLRRDQRRAERHALNVAARLNAKAQDAVRDERVATGARAVDINEFMAASLDRRQHALDAQKLGLRNDAREADLSTPGLLDAVKDLGLVSGRAREVLPRDVAPEGSSFIGPVSLRGVRS